MQIISLLASHQEFGHQPPSGHQTSVRPLATRVICPFSDGRQPAVNDDGQPRHRPRGDRAGRRPAVSAQPGSSQVKQVMSVPTTR